MKNYKKLLMIVLCCSSAYFFAAERAKEVDSPAKAGFGFRPHAPRDLTARQFEAQGLDSFGLLTVSGEAVRDRARILWGLLREPDNQALLGLNHYKELLLLVGTSHGSLSVGSHVKSELIEWSKELSAGIAFIDHAKKQSRT